MTTETKQISTAFLKAQRLMSSAKKDSNNPFFKSKYADLNSVMEAVMPALHDNGIAVLQKTCVIDGKNYLKTILLHESGESLESDTEILFAKQNDAQAQGSGITYARRYGLQSICCIGSEDDDGNKANEQPKSKHDDSELNQACFEIDKCKDLEALKTLWEKHKNFQSNATFIRVTNQRKEKLTPKQ